MKVVLVEKGKTDKWLTEQIGKNEATISRWYSNRIHPSFDMLVKVATLLNVETKNLLNSRDSL